MSDHIKHYLSLLGAGPDATIDEINTLYFSQLQRFSHNLTEEQAEEMQELQHAYAVVRRCYSGPRPKKRSALDPKASIPVVGALAVIAVIVLVISNFSSIELMITRYEPGEVVRWEHEKVPYGQIVSYDGEHRFHTGQAAAAYEIRLANTDEVVWLSHRIVVKGMTRMDSQEVQAAGFRK